MLNSSDNPELLDLKKELEDTQNRFFVFIEKLETRLKEFAESSIPELKDLHENDPDNYKQSFHRMKSAVDGQLETMYKKADEIFDQKVSYYRNSVSRDQRVIFNDFRNDCRERLQIFQNLYIDYKNQIDAVDYQDFEVVYQNIIDEFNTIKDKFTCVQCSSPILIDKLYFTTTYISCTSCETQNTFEPSTQAKQLEHVGRSLAEQRTAHLKKEYDQAPDKSNVLYSQIRDLDYSLRGETNQNTIAEKTIEIQKLQAQKRIIDDSIPYLYKIYLRAMFDEWNAINPAMTQEHEKFHDRILNNK